MAELTPVLVNRETADRLVSDLRAADLVSFADRVQDLVAQDMVLADVEPSSIPAVMRRQLLGSLALLALLAPRPVNTEDVDLDEVIR